MAAAHGQTRLRAEELPVDPAAAVGHDRTANAVHTPVGPLPPSARPTSGPEYASRGNAPVTAAWGVAPGGVSTNPPPCARTDSIAPSGRSSPAYASEHRGVTAGGIGVWDAADLRARTHRYTSRRWPTLTTSTVRAALSIA